MFLSLYVLHVITHPLPLLSSSSNPSDHRPSEKWLAMIQNAHKRADILVLLPNDAVAEQFENDRINVSLWIILSTIVIYDQRKFFFQ